MHPRFGDSRFAGRLVSHEGGEHARLRTIVAPAFSDRRVKLLAQQVEAIAAQLFGTLAARPQPAHLRRHLFFPLAAMVISALECANTLSEAERGTNTGIPGGP